MVYNVPFKGRIWISRTSYDVLRVETDLLAPIAKLQLTRDHLRVDYGPVKFDRGNQTLWLPWDAEMFMELRGQTLSPPALSERLPTVRSGHQQQDQQAERGGEERLDYAPLC